MLARACVNAGKSVGRDGYISAQCAVPLINSTRFPLCDAGVVMPSACQGSTLPCTKIVFDVFSLHDKTLVSEMYNAGMIPTPHILRRYSVHKAFSKIKVIGGRNARCNAVA